MVKISDFDQKECSHLNPKKLKETCCKSYKTARGRCYSCQEYDLKKSDDD